MHISISEYNKRVYEMFNNCLFISFAYRVAVRHNGLVQPGILPFGIEHRRQWSDAVRHTVRPAAMRTEGTGENDCSCK
jgi:hypothetical protein